MLRPHSRLIESNRSERNRIAVRRLGAHQSIVNSYNRLKSVRRTLRACGLVGIAAGPTTLGASQALRIIQQMSELNDVQLDLEESVQSINAQSKLFPDCGRLLRELIEMEGYVNDSLEEWEAHGSSAMADKPSFPTEKMPKLLAFLGSCDEGFREGASVPMQRISAYFREVIGTT